MDYETLYNETIEKLKQNQRPKIKLSKEEINQLAAIWSDLLEKWNSQRKDNVTLQIHKILCILDNTQTLSGVFSPLIIKTLKMPFDQETLIYTLGASQKHIISKKGLDGEPVPGEFIQALKIVLDTKDPELLEWSLRTIEQLGNQSVKLKKEILEKKPSIFGLLNIHKKTTRHIIKLLEKRWSTFL